LSELLETLSEANMFLHTLIAGLINQPAHFMAWRYLSFSANVLVFETLCQEKEKEGKGVLAQSSDKVGGATTRARTSREAYSYLFNACSQWCKPQKIVDPIAVEDRDRCLISELRE
jgi:hypothetical protein